MTITASLQEILVDRLTDLAYDECPADYREALAEARATERILQRLESNALVAVFLDKLGPDEFDELHREDEEFHLHWD